MSQEPSPESAPDGAAESPIKSKSRRSPAIRWVLWCFGLVLGAGLSGVFVLLVALSFAWPQLPSIETVTDYRPKIPLRIFTADGTLIGEFGEERRSVVQLGIFPSHLKQAILAAEDDRFYEHSGIDTTGIARAVFKNFVVGGSKEGASTITQQVARTFFLPTERSGWKAYLRKVYEWMLAFKIEANLSKDQILEIYMNQSYLGQRSYGFAQASQAYFGKNVKDVSIAEAAMLAGLPKAPSTFNPVVNPKRATQRQRYVLGRMRQLGHITEDQYQDAIKEVLRIKSSPIEYATKGDYVAEMARQMVVDMWKDDVYARGLNVYTTVTRADQDAAYASLRKGLLEYDRRRGYRGPEAYVDVPPQITDEWIDAALEKHFDSDDLLCAVVAEVGASSVRALRPGGEVIEINERGLKFASPSLNAKSPPNRKLRPGAVIRVTKVPSGWEIVQLPEAESAFVAINSNDGAVRALVGGFDFNRTKFNHVVQAWRQPGSGFKPFVYSAALEKGFTPATIVNDAPIIIDAAQTGGQTWEPKNYDGTFEGPMELRKALTKSKNMVSIRVLQTITPKYAQDYIARFGFEPEKHPPYLTMALGAGSVTPWQMASAYAVFANGGYRVQPYLISRITDTSGNTLAQAKPALAGDESNRVIDARNAFIMDSIMKDVARVGTAARVATLKRSDLAGKTGTTNDSVDAWFNGYHPSLVAIAWMGFDQPRSLGERETGGGAALPIWMGYMSKVLANVPMAEREVPQGIEVVNGEYYFSEYTPGRGIRSVGLSEADAAHLTDPNVKPEGGKNELF
jgi:penicillin-binding protein 1A